jgi:osmotically-inducible protein OsmY
MAGNRISLSSRRRAPRRRLARRFAIGGRSGAFGVRTGRRGARFGLRTGGRGARFGLRTGGRGARFGLRTGGRGARFGLGAGGRAAGLGLRTAAGGTLFGSRAASKGAKVGVRAAGAAVKASSALADLQRAARPASGAPHAPSAASGFVSGVTTMYFLDPAAGKRRRHVARDRAWKLLRRGGREAAKKARYGEGVAAGKVHDIRAERGQPKDQPDDVTLARTVESMISRDPGSTKGGVNVNAENGVVYLRGQVPTHDVADRLVSAARSVAGVQGVKNLLHLPGERARTAEDARFAS